MDNQEHRENGDIGERIRNVVTDAMESMEFGQLNQAISDTVNFALEEAKKQVKNKLVSLSQSQIQKPQEAEERPRTIRVNWKGKVSGILLTVFGGIGTGLSGLFMLIFLFSLLFFSEGELGGLFIAVITAGVFMAGFLSMLIAGIGINSRIGRLKKYIKELKIQKKPYCELKQLERSVEKALPYIRKDMKKILSLGMLPDVRMDDQETCLMLNLETYQQYRASQDAMEKQQQEEIRKKEEEKRIQENEQTKTVWEAVSRGENYMNELDQLRESMEEQPIVQKLLRLDTVLERVFDALKKHPEQLDEMEQFMEYYLPTTVKLVKSYHEFAQVEFPGENIKKAKTEIEQTLDTINSAFEKLLDDIYQDTAFDVLTDASVLQSMMAREGLTGTDFK